MSVAAASIVLGNSTTRLPQETETAHGWRRLLWLLLCPIRVLFNFIFMDSILPQDDFILRMRKICLGALLLGALVNLTTLPGLVGYDAYLWFRFGTITVPTIATSSFAFVFARCTKRIPDWLFAVVSLTGVITRIPASMINNAIDQEPAVFAYLMVVLMTQLPFVVEVVAVVAGIVALFVNMMAITETKLTDYFLFPTVARVCHMDITEALFSSRVTYVVKVIVLTIVIRQFYYLLRKAKGAVTVSREIAEKLQRYDTTAVREILKRVRDGSADIDKDLLGAFEGIVDNLEKYRPHLPNYLLEPSGSDDSCEEDEPQQRSIVLCKDSPSDTGASGSQALGDVLAESAPGRYAVVGLQDRQRPSVRCMPFDDPSEGVMMINKVRTTVCMTAVDWTAGIELSVQLCNAFVSLVSDVAHTTQASLHSFIGDRVVTTWNATKRTMRSESRAAWFSLRLHNAVANHPLLRRTSTVASMTVSRVASSCFAGDQRLRLFACSSPDLFKYLEAGLKRVIKHHIAAVDFNTFEQARVDVSMRGIAVLSEETGGAPHDRCIYQLLAEREADMNDREWMYTLERLDQHEGHDAITLLTAAVELLAAGRVGEARQKLERLDDTEIDEAVRALLEQMDQQLLRSKN